MAGRDGQNEFRCFEGLRLHFHRMSIHAVLSECVAVLRLIEVDVYTSCFVVLMTRNATLFRMELVLPYCCLLNLLFFLPHTTCWISEVVEDSVYIYIKFHHFVKCCKPFHPFVTVFCNMSVIKIHDVFNSNNVSCEVCQCQSFMTISDSTIHIRGTHTPNSCLYTHTATLRGKMSWFSAHYV